MDKVIFAFGDSITFGSLGTKGGWVAAINELIQQRKLSDPDFWAAIYNLGISGDTSTDLLQRFDTDLAPRLGGEENEFVFLLAIGCNDSIIELKDDKPWVAEELFAGNLKQLIDKSRDHGNDIALLGLVPAIERMVNPCPWRPEVAYQFDRIKAYDDIIRDVAQQNDAQFIDVYSAFDGRVLEELLPDGLHPNDRGHSLVAECVSGYLKEIKILL